jgi:hypothetical protein
VFESDYITSGLFSQSRDYSENFDFLAHAFRFESRDSKQTSEDSHKYKRGKAIMNDKEWNKCDVETTPEQETEETSLDVEQSCFSGVLDLEILSFILGN